MNRKLIAFTFVFAIAGILLIRFISADFAFSLTEEDGKIETLTAIFYLVAFFLCLFTAIKDKRFILTYIWIFLTFFFLGEETSWFQRILNYSVPLVQESNAQNEFNFHNLEIFQGGGLSGGFRWEALLKSQNLFRLGFFGYFLILPLLSFNKWVWNILDKIRYQRPDFLFVLTIIIVFFLSFALTKNVVYETRSSLAETREMLYAFFIMIYVISYIWLKKRKRILY